MKTPLFILLQATGGIRNEVNTFLSDYAVPVIAMLLIGKHSINSPFHSKNVILLL